MASTSNATELLQEVSESAESTYGSEASEPGGTAKRTKYHLKTASNKKNSNAAKR